MLRIWDEENLGIFTNWNYMPWNRHWHTWKLIHFNHLLHLSIVLLLVSNTRSPWKYHDEFCSLLTSIPHSFVAICVSEMWLNKSDKNLFPFPSYCPEYCHRTSSSHGGSAILVLSSVKYKRRDGVYLNVVDCESVWVELDRGSFGVNDKHTLTGSIYRSTSSPVSNFRLELKSILHSISLETKTW